MKLTDFHLCKNNLSKIKISEIYLDSQNRIIISLEGYLNEGNLVFVVKVLDQNLHRQGLGYQAFTRIIDNFGSDNIKSIVGSWHAEDEFSSFEKGMSTNLLIFRRALEEGHSPEEAAFLTPTGKWVQRLEFNKVIIVENSQHCVNVTYTR